MASGPNPTLVFCAKSDEPYTPNVWPADYDTTISVASASTIAHVQRVDKPPDIIILGEKMEVDAPAYAIQKERVVSGSSVATALASGIASLILILARTWDNFPNWQLLKQRQKMLALFERFKVDKSNDIPYVDPKEIFNNLPNLQVALMDIANR